MAQAIEGIGITNRAEQLEFAQNIAADLANPNHSKDFSLALSQSLDPVLTTQIREIDRMPDRVGMAVLTYNWGKMIGEGVVGFSAQNHEDEVFDTLGILKVGTEQFAAHATINGSAKDFVIKGMAYVFDQQRRKDPESCTLQSRIAQEAGALVLNAKVIHYPERYSSVVK